jgi:hypothetical protein
MLLNRRRFLCSTAAMAALGTPALQALANPGNPLMKFIFVFAQGGWDPTRVFADSFDISGVSMEPDAHRTRIGDITFVDHASRPSVGQFLQTYYDRTLLINGVLVPSIAHEICTMLAMTGTSQGTAPDWPTILGEHERDQYTLPSLVVRGPSFPGPYVEAVARTGAQQQLDNLISGNALLQSDMPVTQLRAPSERIIDRYMMRRARSEAANARTLQSEILHEGYENSLQKLGDLKDLQYSMDFTGGVLLADQSEVAIQALSMGVSRTITLSAGNTWDTHGNNDALQSPLWESMFSGLSQLMALLERTPGETTETLAGETTIVVLSEMGRTPNLNAQNGKDHWPITSWMLIGPSITGNRVVGGYDDNYYGLPIDPHTGETNSNGQVLSAEAVGATLLQMGGVDPAPYIRGVEPLTGLCK